MLPNAQAPSLSHPVVRVASGSLEAFGLSFVQRAACAGYLDEPSLQYAAETRANEPGYSFLSACFAQSPQGLGSRLGFQAGGGLGFWAVARCTGGNLWGASFGGGATQDGHGTRGQCGVWTTRDGCGTGGALRRDPTRGDGTGGQHDFPSINSLSNILPNSRSACSDWDGLGFRVPGSVLFFLALGSTRCGRNPSYKSLSRIGQAVARGAQPLLAKPGAAWPGTRALQRFRGPGPWRTWALRGKNAAIYIEGVVSTKGSPKRTGSQCGDLTIRVSVLGGSRWFFLRFVALDLDHVRYLVSAAPSL